MAAQSLKRTFVYNSEHTKYLLENMLEDASNYDHKTVSAVIETSLLDALLPENRDAKMIIEYLYAEDWTIQETLIAIFDYLSTRIDLNESGDIDCKYVNGMDLVVYCMHQSGRNRSIIDNNSDATCNMLKLFDFVIEKMELFYEDYKENLDVATEISYIKGIYKRLEEKTYNVSITTIYTIILTNWEILKNWKVTYRLLSELVKLESPWVNQFIERYELLLLIKKLSNDWN